MPKKKNKVETKHLPLDQWLKEGGDYSVLIVRIVEGVVVLNNPKTNEFYLITDTIQPHKEEKK